MFKTCSKNNGSNGFNQVEISNYSSVSSPSALYKSNSAQNFTLERKINNKILDTLPKSELDTFLTSAKTVYFEQGENIYRPGKEIRFIYFPETAVFSDYKMDEDGKMIEIIMTGKEGVTGVSSLLNNHRTENFTQILQAGHALQIDLKSLNFQLHDFAEIKKSIFDYFNQYINQISRKVICNRFHLIENRLCSWLLMLQDRTGKSQLNLTHEQIALSLGTHRPSITQITKKLREQEMIDYLRGKIFILNRSKLEAAACSCYMPIN